MNYVFTQTKNLNQNLTQEQFLSCVKLVWIQSFPSPRLIDLAKLRNLFTQLFTHSA